MPNFRSIAWSNAALVPIMGSASRPASIPRKVSTRSLGLHDIQIEEVEKGRAPSRMLLMNIASKLDVLTDMLVPPTVAE
jgi:hypothetical protein